MGRPYACFRALLLATVIAAPVVSTGCGIHARARFYDPAYRDYHRWDSREQHAYRDYWQERHEQYRDYRRLNDEQQREYWEWRHHHPGNDRY